MRGFPGTVALGIFLFGTRALACSCAFGSHDGFVHDASPKHLPANAKGVLFRQNGYGDTPPLKASPDLFALVDAGTQEKIALTVRPLSPAVPRPEGLPPAKGEVLFRLEPKGGFKAGHRYVFQYPKTGQSLEVVIDDAKVATPAGAVFLTADEAVRTKMVSIPEGGACSGTVLSRTLAVSYGVAKALEPYRDSLLYFTTYADDVGAPKLWSYQTSACSSVKWGRSDVGLGKDLLYAACETGPWIRSAIALNRKVRVRGLWGFLELEDDVAETNEITATFGASQGECDPSKYVKESFADPASETALEEICKSAHDPKMLTREMLEAVLRFVSQPKVESRRCAARRLEHLPYALQNTHDTAMVSFLEAKVVPALVAGLSDKDDEARVSMARGLTNFARIFGSRWSFASVVKPLAAALKDDKQEVRIAAAEALYPLGRAATSATGALIAAIQDHSKPNYAAPTALAAVATGDAKIVPVLVAALAHPDFIVAGSAARALGTVGDARGAVVPSLVKAVEEKNNMEAVEALGTLGDKASAATPVLLKVARESKWDHMRQAAMKSLVEIGHDKATVLRVIVDNMKDPIGTYTRQKAIESLGKLRKDALPAVPDMVAVVDKSPTEFELGTLVRAWQEIQPPPESIRPALKKITELNHGWVRDLASKYLDRIAGEGSSVR